MRSRDGSVSRRQPLLSGVLLLLAIAGAVIAVDQWTKSWALHNLSDVSRRHVIGPIYLVLTFNQGAAFSLGSGRLSGHRGGGHCPGCSRDRHVRAGPPGVGPTSVVVVGLGLLLGGALSNLGDRLFRHHHGAVVDFIQPVSWWPTFNVADAAITSWRRDRG